MRSGGVGELCGLDVTALDLLYPGLDGCMALDQPGASDPGRCEGFTIVTDLGEVPLPACCRMSGRCGVEVDIGQLGEALGFHLEPDDFGCVDPLPILAKVPYESVPVFWMGAREYPEGGAPTCAK